MINNCECIIGQGSYGKVYRVDKDTVRKEVDLLYLDGEPHRRNIIEIVFIRSFQDNVPFIPTITHVGIDPLKMKINLFMKYEGITLQEYGHSLPYKNRILKLPNLLCQMARMLVWLESVGVAHMDIKNSNLCVNHGEQLCLIDFGLVSSLNNKCADYHGTLQYADPIHVFQKKSVSSEYDMYSMGMTVFVFLNKSSHKMDDVYEYNNPQELLYEYVNLDYHVKTITEVFDLKYANLLVEMLRHMVTLNARKRLTPKEMYKSPIFDKLRRQYPIINDKYRSSKVDRSWYELGFQNTVSDVFRYVPEQSKGRCVDILIKYIQEEGSFTSLDAVASLYLGKLGDDDPYQLETCIELCNIEVSKGELVNIIIDFLQRVKWRIWNL